MSVAIPARELTLDAIRNAKMVARRKLTELMILSGKAQSPQQITIRGSLANDDFGLTNGTDNDEYTLPATTAGVDTTYINNALGNNKYVAIYSFSLINANVRMPVIRIQFKVGTGGANVLADLDLQRGWAYDWPVWFLDDPVIYQPTDNMFVNLTNATTQGANATQLPLGAFIAEPAGQTVM